MTDCHANDEWPSSVSAKVCVSSNISTDKTVHNKVSLFIVVETANTHISQEKGTMDQLCGGPSTIDG